MNTFQVWQVANMTAQSGLLLATVLAALYIGRKQYQINEQLVEMQHQPSIEVAPTQSQLQVVNKGSQNVWLWGIALEGQPRDMQKLPRLITRQGFYYFTLDRFKNAVRALGKAGEINLRFDLYISTVHDRRYTINNILHCIASNENVEVHCQTVGLAQADWSAKSQS